MRHMYSHPGECRKIFLANYLCIGFVPGGTFYPQKQGIALLRARKPTKMTKMAKIPQTKPGFAKNRVFATLNLGHGKSCKVAGNRFPVRNFPLGVGFTAQGALAGFAITNGSYELSASQPFVSKPESRKSSYEPVGAMWFANCS